MSRSLVILIGLLIIADYADQYFSIITSNDELKEVSAISKDGIVAVAYFASWCADCHRALRELDELTTEGKLKDYFVVNIDLVDNALAANIKESVWKLPWVVFYNAGGPVHVVSLYKKGIYREALKDVLRKTSRVPELLKKYVRTIRENSKHLQRLSPEAHIHNRR